MINDPQARETTSAGADTQPASEELLLTPEILGRILYYTIHAFASDANESLIDAELPKLLLAGAQSAPDTIKHVLHIDERSDGVQIEESTRMILGVQETGSIGRLNPRNTQPVFKIDPVYARSLLRRYERLFPQESKWAKDIINEKAPPVTG